MRRVLLLAFSVVAAAALTGCPPKVRPGECKTNDDCAKQAGVGKVCVEGRCQECGTDADCKEGFACQENRCVPKPQCRTDDECPAGQRCDGQRCVARAAGACGSDRDCGPDERCQDGRCAPRDARAGRVSAECQDASAFTIQFGFNESTLTGGSQERLQKLSDCLKQAPAKRVVVQGHADERGTTQYNIALGNRRADAARKYLDDLGGGDAKLETVSFGEEKPVCTEASESCWERNRRVEFQVER
jgi:peptidoglycan-associated lipoprotein